MKQAILDATVKILLIISISMVSAFIGTRIGAYVARHDRALMIETQLRLNQ